MTETEKDVGNLPEAIRDRDRPIIIYQGAPPSQLDVVTGNSLGLIAWLAVISLCIGIVAFSFWRLWNPGFESAQYSPIHAEGRPQGLLGQVRERELVNTAAGGLVAYLDRLRLDNQDRRPTRAGYALMDERGGIDELRRQWDQMCLSIRDGVYDRRIGQIDARIAENRRRRAVASAPAEIAAMEAEGQLLQRQRRDVVVMRQTDGDPSLRCVPAAAAPVCAADSAEPWCHPDRAFPAEFIEERKTP